MNAMTHSKNGADEMPVAYLLDGDRCVCAKCLPGMKYKWWWSLLDAPRSETYLIDLNCDVCGVTI